MIQLRAKPLLPYIASAVLCRASLVSLLKLQDGIVRSQFVMTKGGYGSFIAVADRAGVDVQASRHRADGPRAGGRAECGPERLLLCVIATQPPDSAQPVANAWVAPVKQRRATRALVRQRSALDASTIVASTAISYHAAGRS